MTKPVVFNRPAVGPDAVHYLTEVASSDRQSGDGPFTRRCSQLLREITGAAGVLLTPSCTHALELAALVAGIGPGDDVIVPSFTFVSTANAFALRGAVIRFADCDPATLTIDPASVAALVTERTRAIVPMHYAGVGCDHEALVAALGGRDVHIIEDNAHGLFGSRDGRPLGSRGSMSTLSFHETKNISAGEGGALVLNDPDLIIAAEIAREKGTNRSQFFRGEVDKYTWVGLGSSWLPSEYTAAVLLAALEDSTRTQQARQRVWARYRVELADWATAGGVQLPVVPAGCEQPAHLFHLVFPVADDRERYIAWMKERGLHVVFHYVPLHSSPFGSSLGADPHGCPVSQSVSERLVRLPLWADLTMADVDRVVKATLAFRP